jgi:hypothetical protein
MSETATTGRALAALTDALVPRRAGLDLPTGSELTPGVAALISRLARPVRAALRVYLIWLEFGPASGWRGRYSGLGRADRQEVVRRCLRSRVPVIRDLTRVMAALVSVRFYDDPRVRGHLGYQIEAHVRRVNAIPVPDRPHRW